MGVYIIGFTFSILLLYYAESKKFIGNRSKIAVFIAILIPCFIAGLRDKTIGTDVTIYVDQLYTVAESVGSLKEYLTSSYSVYGWDIEYVSSIEIGFTLLVFFIERIFGSMSVLLFVIQALTVIPIYKGLRAMLDKHSVWLGMAVYYLMFFNQTLNLMRQWIAMAFLFYAFQFLISGQSKKYFLGIVIAILFHKSAVLGVIVFVVYKLVADENSINRSSKALIVILIGLISLFSLDFFVSIIKRFGLPYGGYIDGDLKLMPNQFLYRLPIILLIMMQWNRLKEMDSKALFYVVMVAFDLFASQLTSIYPHSGRLGLYFNEYYMLAYPMVCSASNIQNDRRILRFLVLCFLCIYWCYIYAYGGADETIPYLSIWG